VPTLEINLKDKSYPIYVEEGLITKIGEMLKGITEAKKVAVITDTNVGALYSEIVMNSLSTAGFSPCLIQVEPGEKSKSCDTLMKVYKKLIMNKISRWDMVLALGGGVVGDLAGFAAATYLRGIPYVQVPTSLLAQVDSSIGGKVGIDLPEGKNLIGSFYHPLAVFIDPKVLLTLNARFFSDGMAEVVKYGCIRDSALFERLLSFETKEELLEHMEDIILACLSVKKQVVEEDERDMGSRMILNFGHTLGHAIEKYFGYTTYTHGEAVAMGMYQVTKRSEELGITANNTSTLLKKVLLKYNLPYKLPPVNKPELIANMSTDKKGSGSYLNIVLLKSIGECFVKKIAQEEIPKFFAL